MKVVLIGNGLRRICPEATTGVELFIWKLALALKTNGFDVTILDRKWDAEEVRDIKGLRFIYLTLPQFNIFEAMKMKKLVLFFNLLGFGLAAGLYLRKNQRFDIVHINDPFVGLIISTIATWTQPSLVYTCRITESPLRPKIITRALWYINDYLVKRCNAVIAINPSLFEALLQRGCEKEKLSLILHGVDIDKFNLNEVSSDLKQELGINQRFVILFCGHVHFLKGVEYLIKAAGILKQQGFKDIALLIAGGQEKEYMAYLQNLIKKLGITEDVKFLGSVVNEKIPELYAICDIFVLPSLAEGFSTVICEAMASGKPVIGTKVGGIEAQIKDGRNGFIVPPGDEKALAEKIAYLLENASMREEMGKESRSLAEKEFSWKREVEEYIKVYRAVREKLA